MQRSSSNSLFGSAMPLPVLMHAAYSACMYQQVQLLVNRGPRDKDRRLCKVDTETLRHCYLGSTAAQED